MPVSLVYDLQSGSVHRLEGDGQATFDQHQIIIEYFELMLPISLARREWPNLINDPHPPKSSNDYFAFAQAQGGSADLAENSTDR